MDASLLNVPADVHASVKKSNALLKEGRIEEAFEEIDGALNVRRSEYCLLLQCAVLQKKLGQYGAAINTLQAIGACFSEKRDEMELLIAQCLIQSGEPQAALKKLRTNALAKEGDAAALLLFVRACVDGGYGMDDLQAQVDAHERRHELVAFTARCLYQAGNYAEACQRIQQAISLAPDVAEYRYLYAKILAKEEEYARAKSAALAALQMNVGNPERVHLLLVDICNELGHHDEASEHLVRSWALDSDLG